MHIVLNYPERRGRRVAWMLSMAALCVVMACTKNGSDASAESDSGDAPAHQLNHGAAEAPLSQRELREEYPRLNGGEFCNNDNMCASPLRCVAEECRFPSAMTGENNQHTPHVTIHTQESTQRYYLELAQTLEEQKRGLMDRRHMAADFGMLFVYETAKPQSFWMKNTLMSLDMIFIGADERIVSIVERAEPRSLTPRSSKGDAKYVLELIGGESSRAGIQRGDRVEFSNILGHERP